MVKLCHRKIKHARPKTTKITRCVFWATAPVTELPHVPTEAVADPTVAPRLVSSTGLPGDLVSPRKKLALRLRGEEALADFEEVPFRGALRTHAPRKADLDRLGVADNDGCPHFGDGGTHVPTVASPNK